MEKTHKIDPRVLLKTENLIRDLEHLVNPPNKPIRCEYLRRLILEHHFSGVRTMTLARYARQHGYAIRICDHQADWYCLLDAKNPETLQRFLNLFSERLYHCYRKRMVVTLREAGLLNSYKTWRRAERRLPSIDHLIAAIELLHMSVELLAPNDIAFPTARVIPWCTLVRNRKTKKIL